MTRESVVQMLRDIMTNPGYYGRMVNDGYYPQLLCGTWKVTSNVYQVCSIPGNE